MASDQDKLRQLGNPDAIKNELVKQFTKHIEEPDPRDESVVKVKMVVLGPMKSGKTCWVTRLIQDKFNQQEPPTVGAKFSSQGVAIDALEYHFEIWDVSGEDWCRSLCPMYLQHANAAVVCYDPSDEESFKESKEWVEYVKKQGDRDLLVAFVGLKADLGSVAKLPVDAKEAEHFWVKEQNMESLFFFPDVSSKTGDNVQDVILTIAETFHERGVKVHRGSVKNPDDVFGQTMEKAERGGDFTKKREKKDKQDEQKVQKCKSGFEDFTSWMKKRSKGAYEGTKKFSKKTYDVTKLKSSEFASSFNRNSKNFGASVKKRTATLMNKNKSHVPKTEVASTMNEVTTRAESAEKTL